MTHPSGHTPVLVPQVLRWLDIKPAVTCIDCTVGRGGHAAAIAAILGEGGLLIGLDVDPKNLQYAQTRLAGSSCAVRLFHANFSEIKDVAQAAGVSRVDAILADLGVATNQLFDEAYGLSFTSDMPLDMRLDPREPRSAADLVNTLREEELARLLYELAQERYSRRIARKIVEARRVSPITTTQRLAQIVRDAIPRRGPRRIDPATRTFLALRMCVNRELENLSALLENAPALLGCGGRMAVISFQSMEDRLVKQAFRSAQAAGMRILTPKPITPTDQEVQDNPRSRSARMRVIQKL